MSATSFLSFTEHPAGSAGLLLVCMIVLYGLIIHPLFISPLARIPGPKLAAISSLYLDSRYYTDSATPFIKSLFDKYGPIVRVGPNEVVINEPSQLSPVYGVKSEFPKPPTAVAFQNYGFENAFSAINREDHRNRRKRVAKVYTMNSQLNNTRLLAWIKNRLETVLNIIKRDSLNPIDVFSLATHFALDNVSFMVYGESLNLLEGKYLHAAHDIRYATIASVPFIRFIRLVTTFLTIWPLTLLTPKFLLDAMAARESLEAMNQAQIDLMNSKSTPDLEGTALGCLQNQPDFGKTMTEGHVKSECFDHVIAGADTTAASIIYTLYSLALPENQAYQDKLREEVSKLPYPLDFKAVCSLSYLNICVLESLRLNPPGPGSLQQRVTPPGKMTILTLNGKSYSLPPNTMVGIQAYSLHRNEAVYGARTDKFRPERWETVDEEGLQNMKDAWIPFGTGARTCLGMNLAIIELKMIVTTLIREYIIELPAGARAEDMHPVYAAVIRPKGERCDLMFRPIPSS